MSYQLIAADSIYVFDDKEWNSLAANSSFMVSYGWLAASERIRNIQPRYLAIKLDGHLVGALPCYIDTYGTHSRYQPSSVLSTLPPGGKNPWIIGGSPAGYENSMLVAAELHAGERAEVLRALLTAAAELCGPAGAPGVALGYVSSRDADLLRTVHDAWTGHAGAPSAVIDLPPGGFDGYVAKLSASRRIMVRREMRVFNEAGYRYRIGRLSGGVTMAARLFAQLEHKHGSEIDVDVIQRSLLRQVSTLDDRSFLVTCERAGIVVGCCLLFVWDNRLYTRSAGFDYERLAGAFEYFNLVIYRSVELAYQLGCDSLHLGMGSNDAKTARGAALRPTWWMLMDAKGQPVSARPKRVRC